MLRDRLRERDEQKRLSRRSRPTIQLTEDEDWNELPVPIQKRMPESTAHTQQNRKRLAPPTEQHGGMVVEQPLPQERLLPERSTGRRWLTRVLTALMFACFGGSAWLALPALNSAPATSVAATDAPSTPPASQYVTKNIEDIAVGDFVLARDEHGETIGYRPVKEVYRRTSYHLRHLTFVDEQGREQLLQTTDEHPFWSVTQGKFVNAGDLRRGETVTSPDGAEQTLTDTFRAEHPSGIAVFNFQVEDAHTYYVAQGTANTPVLVHNADYPINPVRVTGDALAAARKEFNGIKPQAWIDEAAANPHKYTPDQIQRMTNGQAPIGSDGFSMEIHHKTPLAEGGSNTADNFEFMTRSDHRLGDNYKLNHPNLP